MGRYYNGDIEGKFLFAVQPSDAPSRFGVEPYEPNYVQYSFFEDEHLDSVKKELDKIESKIDLAKLKKFFDTNNGFNDEILQEAGITKEELRDYADYQLGKRIEECLQACGQCCFDAEL
jgi:hypothetical protein